MIEFWELSFRDKQEMWGLEPAESAVSALKLFKKHGLKKILIPRSGYGRNAAIFIDNGCDVTGIEISETAIDLAKKHYGNKINIYHGSVSSMPFDKVLYDGVFCYALIHLLNSEDRMKLIKDCYNQLKQGGYMVFVGLSKNDLKYGDGKEISRDTFETSHGVNLFFYDSDSIEEEFRDYGLFEAEQINEPAVSAADKPVRVFWQVVCMKDELFNT